ncbi:uncharacterized protein BX663DRAFT_474522 [Cokeromyces recurvatus]|uniref:uncharacterized protein n=1 Tax=Cokeromyces recurvatus TaxID=90255 RepID=UPI0022203373|nr:uncharacterized protein BX663DRAFT_474522 [Cokeromyces recurvatus]KAI7901919.1 hypothetical protein BX663DRAFT_474522 [Cokeromyces recurvatus]
MTLESSSSASLYKMATSGKTSTDTALSGFLWQSPLLFNCHFDETAKQTILTRCYESLWRNDENIMHQHFFSSTDELKKTLSSQIQRHDGKEKNVIIDPKLWHANAILPNQDVSNQKGRQCGHVFRKGEPVYRCRDCGLDDTCVFCSSCFHSTDHDGHDILFSVSPGSGGCCDCGDSEAWKIPLKCKIHSSDKESDLNDGTSSIDPQLINSIRTTIASVLNFLLDTFALAPEEITLNSSIEDLVKENQEQRNTLARMGIPSETTNNTTTQGNAYIDNTTTTTTNIEEDVDMDKENMTMSQITDIPTNSDLSSNNINKNKEEDGELYACIVWNDEAHAFSHVLESIMTATGWDWEKTKQIVDVIHVHGREIIAMSKNIEELRKIAAPLSAINLGVTIRPAKDTFREQACGLLVDWLNELIKGKKRFFPNVGKGDTIIRNILCEELCAEWELRLPLAQLATGVRADNTINECDDEDENGVMKDDMAVTNSDIAEDVEMFEPDSDTHISSKLDSPLSFASSPIVYRSQCDIASIDWDPAAMVREYQNLRDNEVAFGESLFNKNSIRLSANMLGKQPANNTSLFHREEEDTNSAMNIQREFEEKLRLDYFMLYDLKLWKEVRISLRELYIASLASNSHFKKILGKRLARNYARLAESFLLRDREPENSIILFSVQLLTVPTVSDLLVHSYYFFGLICSTLTAFFLTDRLYLLLPSERIKYPSRINCESRAFRTRRYFNAFHDLRYIMNVNMIKRVLAQDPLYLRQYLDLISLFQCMNAQICQKDAHVEYESEIWVNAFNVTLQIAKCCRQFSECFAMLPIDSSEDRVSTAITLVRAILRVLRMIQDWGKMDEEEEDAEQTKNLTSSTATSQKIYGPSAQEYHTIILPYTEEYQVVKYNVSSQPVSFHHPLHWLLAGLLEYSYLLDDKLLNEAGWEGGFKKVITLFNDSKNTTDVLLPILDFSIRTIVFSSQIRAGVWVRNGYGIRNQAHHYRDISLRENTYDADVFLLQLGFATVQPNHLLVTLLDRFDLINWFLGKKNHNIYDTPQTVFMVEELLNLLIVIVCERANLTGMSILDKARREIIHGLCLGPAAYSDLAKRIPEHITEHPKFDHVLTTIAHFKTPDGVNDHGIYELKEEYFTEVDTYFWHFSRNNREEAESIIKARWKKANPDKKEQDFFILPKSDPIPSGPFKHLGSFLQSTLFVQMLFYTLWNTYTGNNHKSDTILDQALYLIMLALVDNNSEDVSNYGQGKFYDYVCSLRFKCEVQNSDDTQGSQSNVTREMTLFDAMSTLYNDEHYNEITSRLDWIFEQLGNKGTNNTRAEIEKWKEQRATKSQRNEQQGELSEVEKKKLAAKERQMRIMAQFAQAQSQFMEKNEFLYADEGEDAFVDASDNFSTANDESNSEGLHRFCAYPTGTCIVCQEDANERSLPYGLLGLIQASNIMYEKPTDDAELLNNVYAIGPNLDIEWQDQQCLADNAPSIPGFPAQFHKTGLYASTCGHFMHIKCFEVYCTSIDSRHSAQLTRNHPENRSRKEFMCPLCKSLGNALLPVFWKGKKESHPGVLIKFDNNNFATFYKSDVNQIVNKLKHAIITTSRHAQMKKTGRDASAATRMKNVMAQLLPTFPAMTTAPGATAVPIMPTAGGNTNVATTRDWTPMGFRTRIPSPTPLDNANNNGLDQLQPVLPLADAQTQQQGQADGDIANTNTDDEAERAVEAMLMQNTYNPEMMPLPDGKLGPFDNDTLHSTAAVSIPFIKKSYNRLLDVLSIIYQEICIDENEREMSTAADNVDILWGVLGYTIAGVEIASRGASRSVTSEHALTHTLFDQIPSQMQMLLRILSDTVMAYTTLMCSSTNDMKSSSSSSISMARVNMFALGRMRQIFEINVDDVANLSTSPSQKIILYDNAPLLEDDPFMILAELSLHLVPTTQADIFPFIHVLLLAEFAKTAVGFLQDRLIRDIDQQQSCSTMPSESSQNIVAAKNFAFSLMNKLHFTPEEAQFAFRKFNSEASFCTLLKFFVLPFLRRTVVLMIVRFGLIIPPDANGLESDPAVDEFDRLMNVLHLPNFADFLQPTPITESLLRYWCSQHVRESERRIQLEEGLLSSISASRLIHIPLSLPTPLYLIPLPKRLDRLFDESMKRVCQRCGTVPSDPAICLFCGTFVCAQSFCCSEDEEGECNLHTLECGGDIGIFLSVKRCVLILLHNGNGWFMNAPYLDPHGEIDQGLRHGRPQYLNTKRYTEIRKLWLQHSIPIYVARQIEANYDVGGWTTI